MLCRAEPSAFREGSLNSVSKSVLTCRHRMLPKKLWHSDASEPNSSSIPYTIMNILNINIFSHYCMNCRFSLNHNLRGYIIQLCNSTVTKDNTRKDLARYDRPATAFNNSVIGNLRRDSVKSSLHKRNRELFLKSSTYSQNHYPCYYIQFGCRN